MRLSLPIALALSLPLMTAAGVAQDMVIIDDGLLEQVPVPGSDVRGSEATVTLAAADAPQALEATAVPETPSAAITGATGGEPAVSEAAVEEATADTPTTLPSPPPAPASADPVPLTAEQIGTGLREHVEALRASAPVKVVTYADMSHNGEDQALVVFDNCDDLGCEWQLIAHKREGGFQSVGASWGQDVAFEATAGGGAVVNSDGVTWAYSGYWIYPYGSLLNHVQPMTGTQAVADAIVSGTEFDTVSAKDIETYSIDLAEGSEGMEKIHVIGGLHNSFGQSGYPFVITDADDKVVESGLSIDLPMVFSRGELGGTTIVWNTPAGFQMVSFK